MEYNELFEETCDGAFEGYGLKFIDGKNALSGPGLKHEDKLPAGGAHIQMGGKGWSNRLSAICRSLVYENIGEDELYEKFYTNRKLPGSWSKSLCYEELAQCGTSMKSKKSKAGNKKAKATSIASPAKSTGSPKIEVKSDGSTTQTNKANKTGPGGVEAIDAYSFLKSMAHEDGLNFDAYSSERSRQEWGKLIVSMAGKIYSRQV